jgi:glyoxylase-like metal-dependent hydrolase (beta-lactamase superfamily II)
MPVNLSPSSSKLPRQILDHIFAFSPNRETLGGTAYLIIAESGNILIDCPIWDQTTQDFILSQGGVRWLFITHRNGIGKKVKQMQQFLDCEVLIQEQEAYLLPEFSVTSFQEEFNLNEQGFCLWTAGFSPGSSCFYYNLHGGILFTGRHLLPNQKGEILPLKTPKTFHWPRQLNSLKKLIDRFNPDTLNYICPGANTGFLRGVGFINDAYNKLSSLELDLLK